MRFLDLFSGAGFFRMGMEQAGHECVGYVEIDKFARQSYQAIFNTEGEWVKYNVRHVSDKLIRKLRRKRGPIHVITAGFPCQAFSIAGKRGGFADTRGTLFFEVARFANILRPHYIFIENVFGLLNHDKGNTFETILRTLDEIGYDAEWDCLNTKDFEIPQNRERVFIIGHLRGASTRKIFPVERVNREIDCQFVGTLDLPGKEQLNRVYSPDGLSPTLTTMQGGRQEPKILVNVERGQLKLRQDNTATCLDANYYKGLDNHQARTGVLVRPVRKVGHLESDRGQTGAIYDPNGIAPTLLKQHGNAVTKIIDDQGRRNKEHKPKDCCPTLRAQSHGNEPKVTDGYRIRKLTPRECWRLQGAPNWMFDRAAKVNSDSQLYKQAGNGVTIHVIKAIAERLEVISCTPKNNKPATAGE